MKPEWMFYHRQKLPDAPKRVSFEWIGDNLGLLLIVLIVLAHC